VTALAGIKKKSPFNDAIAAARRLLWKIDISMSDNKVDIIKIPKPLPLNFSACLIKCYSRSK
jgi:hypothetical protein